MYKATLWPRGLHPCSWELLQAKRLINVWCKASKTKDTLRQIPAQEIANLLHHGKLFENYQEGPDLVDNLADAGCMLTR